MTDYLNTVKRLVERLDLQNGGSKVNRTGIIRERSEVLMNSGNTLSENWREQVTYRHRKQSLIKETPLSTPRKASRGDISGILSGPSSHRASTSLYQLIKSNQSKHLNKTNKSAGFYESVTSLSEKPPGLGKEEDVHNAHVRSDVGRGPEFPIRAKKHSIGASPSSYSTLTPMALSIPGSTLQKSNRTYNQQELRNHNGGSSLKSPAFHQKSPPDTDQVFTDTPTNVTRRKNSGTLRTRLSVSKSVPLSPPPADNPEKIAQQNGEFQYKLDTLRAELLAMRKADQDLAKRLLDLYAEIQILKVKSSCMTCCELLDEAYYEAEMADEVPDMCDAPQKFTNKLLASHGVTSFNIHSRRFSCS